MLKLVFTNAVVEDHGWGLEIDGKSLEDIISTALGTKAGKKGGYGSDLPSFKSNSCDVTVTIDPHSHYVHIESNEGIWSSVEELEGERIEQYSEKDETTDPKE